MYYETFGDITENSNLVQSILRPIDNYGSYIGATPVPPSPPPPPNVPPPPLVYEYGTRVGDYFYADETIETQHSKISEVNDAIPSIKTNGNFKVTRKKNRLQLFIRSFINGLENPPPT